MKDTNKQSTKTDTHEPDTNTDTTKERAPKKDVGGCDTCTTCGSCCKKEDKLCLFLRLYNGGIDRLPSRDELKIQQDTLDTLKEAGHDVFVIAKRLSMRGLESVKKVLRRIGNSM